MRPIEDGSDVYTISDWIDSVIQGYFIDYDGFGELATKSEVSDLIVKPSYVIHGKIQKIKTDLGSKCTIPFVDTGKYTHVVWYNR